MKEECDSWGQQHTSVSLSRKVHRKSSCAVFKSLRTVTLFGRFRNSGAKSFRATVTVSVPGLLIRPPSSTATMLICKHKPLSWNFNHSQDWHHKLSVCATVNTNSLSCNFKQSQNCHHRLLLCSTANTDTWHLILTAHISN